MHYILIVSMLLDGFPLLITKLADEWNHTQPVTLWLAWLLSFIWDKISMS